MQDIRIRNEPAGHSLRLKVQCSAISPSLKHGHRIQSALPELRAAEWIPITAVRVLIGVFFCISGGTKLFVPAQFSEMQQTMIQSHIPFPHGSAPFVSLVEFAGGAGRARTAHSPLRRSAHGGHDRRNLHEPDRSIHASGYLAWLDDFLYLPEVLYVLILFSLLFSGPGRYSVDSNDGAAGGMAGVGRAAAGMRKRIFRLEY